MPLDKKRIIKYLKLLGFALFCAVPLWSQDEYDAHLVGHVLDEKTGEHLPYVNVQVKGTNIGTVTDESGHYFLKNLPIGRQTIVFSYVGYETEELPVNITEQTTTELNAAIREVSQQLNSVVVTANTRMLRTPDHYGYVLIDVKPIVWRTMCICINIIVWR